MNGFVLEDSLECCEPVALVDDEACRLDAELVALAWLLPEDYRCVDESE